MDISKYLQRNTTNNMKLALHLPKSEQSRICSHYFFHLMRAKFLLASVCGGSCQVSDNIPMFRALSY